METNIFNPNVRKIYQLKITFLMFLCITLYASLLMFFDLKVSVITIKLYLAFTILILPLVIYRDILHPFVVYSFTQFLMLVDIAYEVSESHPSLRYLSVPFEEVPSLISEALTLWIAWYLIIFLGFFIGNKLRFESKKEFNTKKNRDVLIKNPTIIACIFFFLSLLFFVYAIFFINNGFVDMLNGMRQRTETYSGLAYIVYFSRLGVFSAVLFLFKGHKWAAITTVIISLSIISLYGSRGTALVLLISFLIAYHYKIKKINFFKILPLGFIGLIFLQVFGKQRFSGDFSFKVNFDQILYYAANQKQTSEILPSILGALKLDQLNFQMGKDFFNILFAPIPRSLWEGKPQIDESGIIGKLLMGSADFWGLPAGAYGWIYLNFWWFGILFFGILSGFVAAKLYNAAINKNKFNQHYIFIVYVFSVPFLLDIFTTSAQIQVLFNILVVLVILCLDKFITLVFSEKFSKAVR